MIQANRYLDGIHLDRNGPRPLYHQVADAIRDAIGSGDLTRGVKLPSTREACERLRVNRATVVDAYRILREEGWVVSGVGAGTFVRLEGKAEHGGTQEVAASFWSSRIAELPRPETSQVTFPPEGTIRLTSPTADPRGFPVEEFRGALGEVFRREGAGCLDYGPPDGYPPLRDLIAERLARRGVQVDRSRIILVNGSQQGLELILRLLVPRGRTLLVEEPTYHLALRTARALGLPVRTIPMDEEGLRVDRLERILDETRAGMLYTMPVFQNPTGLTLSQERRGRLLQVARERNLPVVEDHYDAELDYRGDAPGPLLAEGSPPGVVLLGTFSKILFPAPRVGWLVVPDPLVGPLGEMKVCADLSSGLMTQMALHEFCSAGNLDRHLARIRERNGRRLTAMLAALEESMPPGVRWTRPSGGMTLWLWLPKGLDADSIAREGLDRGVALAPGTAFYIDGGGRDGLRLSFIREDEGRIEEGIRLLAETIREQSARRPVREGKSVAAPIL